MRQGEEKACAPNARSVERSQRCPRFQTAAETHRTAPRHHLPLPALEFWEPCASGLGTGTIRLEVREREHRILLKPLLSG